MDGSFLPPDLLDIILDKLLHISDYARFSAVCKLWNFVAVDYQKQKRIAAVHDNPPPPMLLFLNPADYHYTGFFKLSSRFNLFSISEESLYQTHVFRFRFDQRTTNNNVMCLGSSYGWLALKISESSKIILLNPFTRKVIELPKLSGTILKIIMSCDPCKNSEELVVAGLGNDGKYAIIKLGQECWRIFSLKVIDMIFHKGMLYALDSSKILFAIDYKNPQECVAHRIFVLLSVEFTIDSSMSRTFLVEASDGELLLLELRLPNLVPNFWRFYVYEIKTFRYGSIYCWRRMYRGNSADALFLSDNSCLCIPAAESGMNPNSIYFSLSFFDKRYPSHNQLAYSQTGVYNLGDGTLTELPGLPLGPKGVYPPVMVPIALLSPCIG